MNRKTVLMIALLLLAPIVVAAATNIRPAVAVETLKVGVLVPYRLIQGDAWTGGAEGGAILGAMDINAAGGINIGGTTYMIELVKDESGYFEDECAWNPFSPQQAYYNTKDLINAGCKFIIGGFRTECTWEIMRAIAEHNAGLPPEDWVIYFINGASTDALCNETYCQEYLEMPGVEFDWRFRINPINSTRLFYNVLGWMQGYLLPVKLIPFYGTVKFACIAEQLEWTEKICWYFANVGLGSNTEFVGCVRTPQGTQDFESYLEGFKAAGANLVCHFYTLDDSKYLVMKWRQKEYPFLLVGIDVFGQAAAWPYMTGGACEYEMTEDFAGTRTPITPLAVQFWDHFVGNFSRPGAPPAWPVYTAWGAYNAFLSIKAALETAGSLDSTKIIEALESQELWVLNGKAKFTSSHDVWTVSYGPTWPDKYTRAFFIQWVKKDGTFVKEVVCPVDQEYSRKTKFPPWIHPLGDWDLNFDGFIDYLDINPAARAFGSSPGDPRWYLEADITADAFIDYLDINPICRRFGQHI